MPRTQKKARNLFFVVADLTLDRATVRRSGTAVVGRDEGISLPPGGDRQAEMQPKIVFFKTKFKVELGGEIDIK